MAPEEDTGSQLGALADAARVLAGELGLESVLRRIVESSRAVTGARYAALGVLGEDGMISRFLHAGLDEEIVREIGELPRGHGVLGLLIRHPEIIRLDDISSHPASVGFPDHHPPMKSFLGAPVRSGGRIYGNLYLTEKDGGFDETDERALEVLAAQAGAAIENALLSDRLQDLAVQEERDRISRELHDGVIQVLFSIGMSLESARGFVDRAPDRVVQRIDAAVDGLDGAIRELRNYIFRLRPQEAAAMGLGRGLTELAREYEVNALTRPVLEVEAGADARVPARLVPDLLQIVREALSNAAKHARAREVTISLKVHDQHVHLTISDDGVGFAAGGAEVGRGLENMRERARVHGGTVHVRSTPGEGTTVALELPLEDDT